MKNKMLYIVDKIGSGVIFIIFASMFLLVLIGLISMFIAHPIYFISTFLILFIVGYIVDKLNIIPFK